MALTDTFFNSKQEQYFIDAPVTEDTILDVRTYIRTEDDYLKQTFEYKCSSGSVVVYTKIYDSSDALLSTDTNTLAEATSFTENENSIDISTLLNNLYRVVLSVKGNNVEIKYIDMKKE